MPVVNYGPWRYDTAKYPLAREWAKFLIDSIGKEPGLAMWDVMNEPDWPTGPKEWVEREFATAKFLANTIIVSPQDDLPSANVLNSAAHLKPNQGSGEL